MTKDPEEEIIHRNLDTDTDNPAAQVADSVAEIEDRDLTDLPPIYGCLDGILDNLFSNPPDPEAQLEIEFSYETYRIRVGQDGKTE